MGVWLYDTVMPLCRVRRLVDDQANSGTLTLLLPAHLIDDVSRLSAALTLYDESGDHAERLHGLAVHRRGDELALTVMPLGSVPASAGPGLDDDWLLVDGRAVCQVVACVMSPGGCPKGPHVRVVIPGRAWRRLPYRRAGLGALRGLAHRDGASLPSRPLGLMLPLSDDGPRVLEQTSVGVELLRLRPRARVPFTAELADAGWSEVTLIGHAGEARPLAESSVRRAARSATVPSA